MSNTDKDELHMRAIVCLKAMCSVEIGSTKILENDDDDNVDVDDTKKEEEKKQDEKKEKIDKGDPLLALKILAGYEHTIHYDGMNTTKKNELTENMKSDAQWLKEIQDTIQTSKEQLEEANEKLFLEKNSHDDENEIQDTSSVEIQVLDDDEEEEEDEEDKPMIDGVHEKKDALKKKLKDGYPDMKPVVVKKEERIERLQKSIVDLKKILNDSNVEIKEAMEETKKSKTLCEKWEPEMWKGGIGVLNAFTKIPQIGEGTKAQALETLKLISDRL